MPFQKRRASFWWEEHAAHGEELVVTLAVGQASKAITRVLRVAFLARVVFVVCRHKTPLLFIASPYTWQSVLSSHDRLRAEITPVVNAAIPQLDLAKIADGLRTTTWSVWRFQHELHHPARLSVNDRRAIEIQRHRKPYVIALSTPLVAAIWYLSEPAVLLLEWLKGLTPNVPNITGILDETIT